MQNNRVYQVGRQAGEEKNERNGHEQANPKEENEEHHPTKPCHSPTLECNNEVLCTPGGARRQH